MLNLYAAHLVMVLLWGGLQQENGKKIQKVNIIPKQENNEQWKYNNIKLKKIFIQFGQRATEKHTSLQPRWLY